MRNMLAELQLRENKLVKLWIDNKSAIINLAKHPIAHGKSKHIDTRYHYLRNQVGKGNIKVEFCSSQDQKANVMTKALNVVKFKQLREMHGIKILNELN